MLKHRFDMIDKALGDINVALAKELCPTDSRDLRGLSLLRQGDDCAQDDLVQAMCVDPIIQQPYDAHDLTP